MPFNSVKVDGVLDRKYKAEDWMWFFGMLFSSGVMPNPSDGLQVVAHSGMEVRVNAGYAIINGGGFRNPSVKGVTLEMADGALNRIDRVVIRWDLTLRDTYIAVLKGAPSAKPTATALTRGTEVWELAIADVYVGKGVTRIRTQDITDQRFNSALCGIAAAFPKGIDASVLTRQFDDFFKTYRTAVLDEFGVYKQDMETYLAQLAGVHNDYVTKTESLFTQYENQFGERYDAFGNTLDGWDAELLKAYSAYMANAELFQTEAREKFDTWFENVKGQLGEDAAGNLQLEIDGIRDELQGLAQETKAGTTETKEELKELAKRVERVESGWGIDLKHDAVLGLCYMGAAYMSQPCERAAETAVLGLARMGGSYLANTF